MNPSPSSPHPNPIACAADATEEPTSHDFVADLDVSADALANEPAPRPLPLVYVTDLDCTDRPPLHLGVTR